MEENKKFKVLLEDGYSPVVAWFVCFYEVKNIVDLGIFFLWSYKEYSYHDQ